MIRGVSRRIVEINECNSTVFEKVIFFVRPESAGYSDSALRDEADQMIAKLCRPVSKKRRKYKISRRVLWLMTAVSSVSAVILAIFRLAGC